MSPLPARDTTARPGTPRSSRLPSSDELFRRTAPRETYAGGTGTDPTDDITGIHVVAPPVQSVDGPDSPAATVSSIPPDDDTTTDRRPTGRERHDEKITVYVSNDELIDLEHARLTLKRLGVKADRGRIVREALAELISDLERNRETAVLVRRLRTE